MKRDLYQFMKRDLYQFMKRDLYQFMKSNKYVNFDFICILPLLDFLMLYKIRVPK
jgi:hypothetical protein